MSRRLLVMLIFIALEFESKPMISSSLLNHIEDCFYEKRVDTSLNGYNDHHGPWISELDCLDRCLKHESIKCRSFEHWRSQRHGLCVRANMSLTDLPSSVGINTFVDYYEIDCRNNTKAVSLQMTSCHDDQLKVLVKLNGIDPNYVLLGDNGCKPIEINETHVYFMANVKNCSLIQNNGSVIGKIRWEGVVKDSNEARQYERYFLCSNRTSRINSTTLIPIISTTAHSMISSSNTFNHHRITIPFSVDEQPKFDTYRIDLKWIYHNETYRCPPNCSLTLHSLIYIIFDDLPTSKSKFLIETCDFMAMHPYSNYVKTRRLIYRGCSTDPSIITSSYERNSLLTFHYSFYLYNIIKEPIPFEIQCQIINNDDEQTLHQTNCSAMITTNYDYSSIIEEKQNTLSYLIFRSESIDVKKQRSLELSKDNTSHIQNSHASIIAVHCIQCFFVLIIRLFY